MELAILYEEYHGNKQIRDYCSSMITRFKSIKERDDFSFLTKNKEEEKINEYLNSFLGIENGSKKNQIIIIDLNSANDETVEVVSCVLSRMLFEKLRNAKTRNSYPINLVLEEAHRYISNDSGKVFGDANKIFERIAKEGRKYGMFLLVSSQRPSELSKTVLSQCSNFIVHRKMCIRDRDIVGRVYEYFLSKFALAEGKGKGEFYTPKSIVNLIAEMIEPYKGIIYDPACGSGGMFVQSIKFIENHHGNKKEVSIYGQEYTNTTYKLAKMNLAIRGISANLGEKAADTFGDDQHKDLKADYIMANPPFNQKDWRADKELVDDPRWRGYDVPPKSNANYAWILNMVSKLSDNGVAGFILANGALSGGGEEYKIRKTLIENNLVEAILDCPAIYFTPPISALRFGF